MKQKALSIFLYVCFTILALLLLPVMLVTAVVFAWDPSRRYPGRLMRFYGRLIVRCVPSWDFSVEGSVPEDIDRRGYVVIANHESTGDIFLLTQLPWDMRWVAKAELMRVPLLGQLLWLSGDIALKRGNRESILHMLTASRKALSHGLSVMIFPEGTRSKDGQLGRFKDGAFQIALENGVPILPLALVGTRQCWTRHDFTFGKARARARILDPIPTQGKGIESLAELRDEARHRIEEALLRMTGKEETRQEPRRIPVVVQDVGHVGDHQTNLPTE